MIQSFDEFADIKKDLEHLKKLKDFKRSIEKLINTKSKDGQIDVVFINEALIESNL